MDISYWIVFMTAAFALCISPGPDLIYIMSKAAAQGARSGIFAAAGVCSGAYVHVFAAAFGISAILAASAAAFTAVKLTGAAYLFYLGIKAFFAKSEKNKSKPARISTDWKTYKQGALIDILNPKVSIFFMAFLPQFVRTGHGSTMFQIILLGTIVISIGFIVEVILVLLATRATGLFRSNSRFTPLLEKMLGSVLIGLGLRLALSVRR